MKKKFYGLMALTLLGVALSSCGKSKNVSEKDTTTVADTSTDTSNSSTTTSADDDLSTTTKTKTTTTTTTEEISIPTTSIDIPDMDEASLEQIYTDFKKIKLPNTYTKVSNKNAYLNAISIDNSSDDLLSYDCIEQTGYEKEDDTKTNYLIDNSTAESADQSYSGSIFGAYIYDVAQYVENVRAYEEQTYGGYTEEFYSFQQKYILSYLSQDGTNRDLLVFDNKGLVSYINISDVDKIYDTKLIDNSLSNDDVELLNLLNSIKYNQQGAIYNLNDYDVESLVVPEIYRNVAFAELDLDKLSLCNNLKEIIVSNGIRYKTIDGVLYNKSGSKLLFYPKAKEGKEFDIPEDVTSIRSNSISNANLETINVSSNVGNIEENAFKGSTSLKELSLPFIGYDSEDDENGFAYLFGDNIPSIEKLYVEDGVINENKFVGLSSVKELDVNANFSSASSAIFAPLTSIEKLTLSNVNTISIEAFKDITTLKEVNLPNVVSLGTDAFNGCTSLKTINAAKLGNVGQNALSGCTSLTTVNFPRATSYGNYALKGCSALTTLDLSNVTSLGDNALEGCSKLENVDLSNIQTFGANSLKDCTKIVTVNLTSATSIPDGLFTGCTALTTINNANNVTSIGNGSFSGCSKLASVSFDGVKSVSSQLFSGCSSLESASFNTATVIGSEAFKNCSKLKTLSANSVTKIYDEAFWACSALTELSFPQLQSIGYRAFKFCSKLTSVSFPNLTSAGIYAFSECDSIQTATLTSLTSFSSGLFYGCDSLVNVNYNASKVTSLGEYAFYNCPKLKGTYNSSSGKYYLSFPSVTEVGNAVFARCTSIQLVTFDSLLVAKSGLFMDSSVTQVTLGSATTLEDKVFMNCTKLTIVSANKATSIGDYAFQSCTSLTSADFSAVTTIGIETFKNSGVVTVNMPALTTAGSQSFGDCSKIETFYCPKLTSTGIFSGFIYTGTITMGYTTIGTNEVSTLTFFKNIVVNSATSLTSKFEAKNIISFKSTSLTELPSSAFYGCTSLTTVYLPYVTSIQNSGFYGCTKLSTITFGSLKTLYDNAFYSCTSLTSISLSSVTGLGASTFKGCSGLTSITANNISSIPASCFQGCTGLTKIECNSATQINNNAFNGCSALDSVTIPNATRIYAKAFYQCSALTTIKFQYCTTIGDNVFSGCSALSSISLPAIESIGDYCFQDCVKITGAVWSTLTSAGQGAFKGCTAMTGAYFSKLTSIPANCFSGCTKLIYYSTSSNVVTSIGQYAFENCSSFTTAGTNNDPSSTACNFDTVTSIGTFAFKNCTSLGSVSLRAFKGASIGAQIFNGCTSLQDIELSEVAFNYNANFNASTFSNVNTTIATTSVRFIMAQTPPIAQLTSINSCGNIFSFLKSGSYVFVYVSTGFNISNYVTSSSILTNTTYFSKQKETFVSNGYTVHIYEKK